MATEFPQIADSKELEFMNWNNNDPKAVAGITKKQNLRESVVATRMQHKRKLEMNNSESNKIPRLDLSPIVYITAQKIGGKLLTWPMIVLLDSGSSHTMMKQSSLPHGATPML